MSTIIIHKIPCRCPVCGGNGIVADGFYTQTSGQWSSSGTTEPCRSCMGTGIVYSEGIEKDFCDCGIRYSYLPSGNCINCNKPINPWKENP